MSPHEATVHDKFLDTIRWCDGRYEVSLTWKEQHTLLPDNYALAVSRLASVLKCLRGNPELFAEYSRIIDEQSSQEIISDVDANAPVQVGRLYYLAHHPVVREDKQTTKVRIVYDASAKSTGPSLNDCLQTGPSLTSEIPDVLIQFRYHQVALVADIEKTFLMVQVAEADRDVLRFLWINDLTSEDPNIVVKRFNRVVFGVTSSPFLLNRTVRHHVSNNGTLRGLNWDIARDTFMFYFDWLVQFAKELPLNKRSILKVVAKLYDPLGLILPLFITVKALFQDLCKLKISWNEPLNEDLALRYSSWLSDLLKVQCIPVERCYMTNSEENVVSFQIHGFGDSSEVA